MAPLLAKPYVLDLAPGLSLVDHLAERGLELFLLDFGIPDRQDRHLRFEDHLRGGRPGHDRRARPEWGQAGDAAGLLHFWDPRYLERQRLVSRWLNDLVPFPGEAYRQFVKELVQANKLVRGELVVDGNVADPAQITCPVLVLAHT